MSRIKTWIDARDKPALLLAVMRKFCGNSHISFEGDLNNLNLESLEGAETVENNILKRQTTHPVLDFVVVPLTEDTLDVIWRELSEKDHLVNEGIIHVQIESEGSLVFGGYDNFDPHCTIAYLGIPVEFIEELKDKGIIRSFNHESA